MIHELADYDPTRIRQVLKWPMREAMLCYLNQLKKAALEAWRHDTLCYSVIAPHSTKPGKPPSPPRILRDRQGEAEE